MAREDETKHRVVPVYLDGLTSERADIPYGLRLKHGLTAAKDDALESVARLLLELLAQLTGRSFEPQENTKGPANSDLERRQVAVSPALGNETVLSESANSRVRRGRHPLHGMVLVKDLLTIPDESIDLIASRHYRALLGDRLIEVGRREDGTLYELLREIPGYDLSAVVTKSNVITGALLDDIALQILHQLAALHGASKPVIHRDVRPTNFILSFERDDRTNAAREGPGEVRYKPVVRLIDYDTGCFANDPQTPWGAHGFTAPEQRQGRAVPASDLFSLISSLYFLATGRVPADANSWPRRECPPFNVLYEAYCTEMSEVYGHDSLLSCWSFDAAQRPVSAVAFLDRNPVPGTKLIPPPKRMGALSVGEEWEVELFDMYYVVKRQGDG